MAPAGGDARFQKMHTDPRFKKLPRSKLKLPVDARFRQMLTDKAFVDPFGIDKRGRPAKKKKRQHTMQRYYKFEEDGEEKDAAVAAKVTLKDAVKVRSKEEDENVAAAVASSSDESSSSSESDSDESSSESDAEEDEEDSKVATTTTETRRLAVVNMDWNCIKAVDLLVLFNSFVPKGGSVTSVAVYPSQFGLEQMKKEEVQGPSVFHSQDGDSDDDEDEVDVEKLRHYEKSKLRYYFAVLTCDSVSTASVLYSSCDGMEFERTSNILDLQFIPDDMQFDVEAREVATEVVGGYEAPDYQTRALQLSNVKLTWDDDEPVRVKHLRKRFNADELADMDYKAYMASDDEEEDADDADEARKNKLRSLLLEGVPDDSPKEKSAVDMEITFPSGLDELSKKYLDDKRKGDETVWEARLRKKRESKAQKKKDKKKAERKDEEDEDGFDDPFFDSDHDVHNSDSEKEDVIPKDKKKATAAENRKERELKRREDGRSKAELELLLLNEDGDKVKTKKKDIDSSVNEKLSTDPRFSALFKSHHFAIDPTDPRFKRSAAKLRVVAEMQQKRFDGATHDNQPSAVDDKSKVELSSLVKSLKRKAR